MAIWLLLLPCVIHAYDFPNVTYVRAYAGNTFAVTIPDTHLLSGKNISIRVEGIDTPEIRGKDKKEKRPSL